MRRISPARRNQDLLRALAGCQELRNSARGAGTEWPAALSCNDPQRELDVMLELRTVLQALARKLNVEVLVRS
jgi:hypothetical protein